MSKSESAKEPKGPTQQTKKEQKHKPKKEPQQEKQNVGMEKADKAPDQKSKQQPQPPGAKKQLQNQPKKTAQQQQPAKKTAQQQQPAKKSGSSAPSKSEHEKKEDVFQAVLLADNFGSSIFGPESPLLQEGLVPMTNRRLIDFSLESLTSSGVQEIFLCCSTETEELRSYIQSSRWEALPHCAIRVLVVEDALSLGDALRELDAKGFLRSEFILMGAGVVSNVPLRDLLTLHQEHLARDKGAVLTLVHRRLLPGHRSRGRSNNPVIVVDSESGKVLAYEAKPSGKRLQIPLEKVGAEMEILMDCVETGIAVCSASVPPLFTDNFDFTSLGDAVKEIMINEEILGNSIYLHRLERGYANSVVDFDTYRGISADILQRWTFPCVPDMRFGAESEPSTVAMHANFVYKAANVKVRGVVTKCAVIGAHSEVGRGSSVHASTLGSNCLIGPDTHLLNCQLGDNVHIAAGSRLSGCILTAGTVLKEREELEGMLLVRGERFPICAPGEEVESSDEEETSDAEGSELSSGEEVGHHVDQDLQLFNAEVAESLLRGFRARVATENLVLEINSSKFAYNMSFKEVTGGIVKALLSLPPRLSPEWGETGAKAQWERTKEVVLALKGVLANYVKTEETQLDLLEAVEEHANDTPLFRPLLTQTLHLLYDEDVLSEEAILRWHRHPSLYDAGAELRRLVTKLIAWLEAPDSDEEEEEEE